MQLPNHRSWSPLPARALALAALLPFLAPLSAQEGDQDETTTTAVELPFVPADADLVFQLDGVPRLRERFAATNLVRMIETPEFQSGWEPFAEAIRDELNLDSMRPATGLDPEPILDALRGYAGRLTLAVALEPLDPALLRPDLDEEDAFRAIAESLYLVAVFAPDGETDLAALADIFLEHAEDTGAPYDDIDLGGATAHLVDMPDMEGVQALLPSLLDGHLVVGFGGDLEGRLAALVAEESPRFRVGAESARHGLWAQIEPGLADFTLPLLSLALAEVSSSFSAMMGGGGGGFGAEPAVDPDALRETLEEVLRLRGFQGLTVGVRPAGERVLSETVVRHDPARPSLVDLMQPDLNSIDLLRLVPRRHEAFSAAAVDIGLAFQMVVDLIDELGPSGMEMSIAEQFRESTGYDLHQDLLGRIDGQLVIFNEMQSLAEEGVEPGMQMLPAAYTLILGLTDAQGFAAMFDDLLRQNGMQAMRRSREYRGVEVFTLTPLPIISFDYAFIDGAMLLGIGGRGADTVREVIDRKLDAGDVEEWPESVSGRLEHVDPDWRNLSVSRSTLSTETIVTALLSEFDGGDPDPELRAGLEQILDLLEPFELRTQLGAASFASGRAKFQVVW